MKQGNYPNGRNESGGKRPCNTDLQDFCEKANNRLEKRDWWVDFMFMDCQKALDTVSLMRLVKN